VSFNHERFANLRSWLYHSTTHENFSRIRKEKCLKSARLSMRELDRVDLLVNKRQRALPIGEHRKEVTLQSQRLLIDKNIEWEPGWNLARFLKSLNSFVFFCAGTENGPCRNGMCHSKSKDGPHSPIMMRVPTAGLFSNAWTEPRFSRYNSGSPRMTPVSGMARRSPRGGQTFLPAGDFPSTVGNVVEVVIEDHVALPDGCQYRSTTDSHWLSI